MNRFLRIRWIVLFGLAGIANTHAAVHPNHGPAFLLKSHATHEDRVSQRGLLKRYILFNTASLPPSVPKSFADAPFLLAPADLTKSHLSFGYKNAKGIYHDFDFVQTEFGYCHGMTMVTRNFAYFAKFDATLPAPFDFAANPSAWIEFYQDLVDRVMRDELVVIPGYANLMDFSASPIADYLQRHVVDQWAIQTGRIASYLHIYKKNFKPLANRKDVEDLRAQIESYLAHGFFPRIVLGSQRYSVNDPHVVMVTGMLPPASVDDACVSIDFFNLGADPGGYPDHFKLCVGDRGWIPTDEDAFLYDFARELLNDRSGKGNGDSL